MPNQISRRRFLELELLSVNATLIRCTPPARVATPPITVSVPPVSLAAQKAIVRDANGEPRNSKNSVGHADCATRLLLALCNGGRNSVGMRNRAHRRGIKGDGFAV